MVQSCPNVPPSSSGLQITRTVSVFQTCSHFSDSNFSLSKSLFFPSWKRDFPRPSWNAPLSTQPSLISTVRVIALSLACLFCFLPYRFVSLPPVPPSCIHSDATACEVLGWTHRWTKLCTFVFLIHSYFLRLPYYHLWVDNFYNVFYKEIAMWKFTYIAHWFAHKVPHHLLLLGSTFFIRCTTWTELVYHRLPLFLYL